MRIRIPIAIVFLLCCVLAGYLSLNKGSIPNNRDKLVHVIVFFVLTILFYWSIDAPRKRAVNLTLFVCCFVASIGSEFLQHLVTQGERRFDINDIAANIVGSIFATVLSSLYHGRLNRRRKHVRYERMRQDVESAEVPTDTTDMELAPMDDERPSAEVAPTKSVD